MFYQWVQMFGMAMARELMHVVIMYAIISSIMSFWFNTTKKVIILGFMASWVASSAFLLHVADRPLEMRYLVLISAVFGVSIGSSGVIGNSVKRKPDNAKKPSL